MQLKREARKSAYAYSTYMSRWNRLGLPHRTGRGRNGRRFCRPHNTAKT